VIQDRAAEVEENLEGQADLPAEAERVQTIHEAVNPLVAQTESHFHAHAVIVTIQNQDALLSFQEKEKIKKIFQNHVEVKPLADQKIKALAFLLVVTSLSLAHAMIVTIQSQEDQAHHSQEETIKKIFQNLVAISPSHVHVMIGTIQNQEEKVNLSQEETIKKIFQNHAEANHSVDREMSHLDFLPVAINLPGHVMKVMTQNQDALRSFPDQLITRSQEVKDVPLAHVMIAMNQNHVMRNLIVPRNLQTKKDFFLN
jgi:hypothetical protein